MVSGSLLVKYGKECVWHGQEKNDKPSRLNITTESVRKKIDEKKNVCKQLLLVTLSNSEPGRYVLTVCAFLNDAGLPILNLGFKAHLFPLAWLWWSYVRCMPRLLVPRLLDWAGLSKSRNGVQ
jgi:hypothetical protein